MHFLTSGTFTSLGFLEERGDSEEKKNAFVCQALLPVFSPHCFVLISPYLLLRPETQITERSGKKSRKKSGKKLA